MKHYYVDLPGLGNVAVSRHAQARAEQEGITEAIFEDVLRNGVSTPDGMDVIHLERQGVRLVILLKPTPFRGAKLVKTVYRIKASAKAHK